jgi:hypothetical protein
MPHTKIEIEEIEKDRWVAEVEVGGLQARRQRLTARSDVEILLAVAEALHQMTPGGSDLVDRLIAAPGRKAHEAHKARAAAEAKETAEREFKKRPAKPKLVESDEA